MGLPLLILFVLFLNMFGVVLGKYLAMNIGFNILSAFLFALVFLTQAMRVVFWIVVGRKYQLSYIYPVLSINYVFSFFLGMYLFHEHFEMGRCIGAFVIVAGVLVVSLSGHKYERPDTQCST